MRIPRAEHARDRVSGKGHENVLAYERREAGFSVAQQNGIAVACSGIAVGKYIADLVVESTVVVEVKARKTLDIVHTAQCVNYLKAIGVHLCLLLNLGKPRLKIHRVVHEL